MTEESKIAKHFAFFKHMNWEHSSTCICKDRQWKEPEEEITLDMF